MRAASSAESRRRRLSIDRPLLSVHLKELPPETRTDRDHPLGWFRRHGKGRVFYNAFGHNPETVPDKTLMKHWLAGIQYALGDLKADDSPSDLASAPPVGPPPTKH